MEETNKLSLLFSRIRWTLWLIVKDVRMTIPENNLSSLTRSSWSDIIFLTLLWNALLQALSKLKVITLLQRSSQPSKQHRSLQRTEKLNSCRKREKMDRMGKWNFFNDSLLLCKEKLPWGENVLVDYEKKVRSHSTPNRLVLSSFSLSHFLPDSISFRLCRTTTVQ